MSGQAVKEQVENSISVAQIVHTIIGISLMLFGRFIPGPSMVVESSERLINLGLPAVDGGLLLAIPPFGMNIIGLFLGVVYLWSTVHIVWPSILSVILLGFSDYAPMPQVLVQFFGNPLIVYIVFLLLFAAILVRANIAVYLARFLVTLPIVNGRPWVLTFVLLVTCYAVACLGQISSVFIMWPTLYVIFEQAGFKKGDPYVSIMVVASLMMILLSFATDPIKDGSFFLLSNLMVLSANNPAQNIEPINLAKFLLFGFSVSVTATLAIFSYIRFIAKPDVSALRNFNTEELKKNPLPPMTWKQKSIIFFLGAFAAWMLLPGIIGRESGLGAFISHNMLGGTMIIIFAMTFIHYKGEPIADLREFGPGFPWGIFFLIAVAFLLGAAMVHKDARITLYLEYGLRNLLGGMSYTPLIMATCVIALLVTNFSNSGASGIMLTPVLLAMCDALGVPPNPLLACFFFTIMIAAITPAASPFAAMLFANKDWIDANHATRYAFIFSVIILLCMFAVGIPLAINLF